MDTNINQIIADRFGFSLEQIEMSDEFVADLGADSLDMVELTMDIEDALGITVPDDHAAACRTVQDVHEMVARLQP